VTRPRLLEGHRVGRPPKTGLQRTALRGSDIDDKRGSRDRDPEEPVPPGLAPHCRLGVLLPLRRSFASSVSRARSDGQQNRTMTARSRCRSKFDYLATTDEEGTGARWRVRWPKRGSFGMVLSRHSIT
jgi:hypothetical protein